MNMNKLSLILLVGAAAISAASCSGNLDIDEHGVTNISEYYKTDAEIESAGASLYSDLRDQVVNGLTIKDAIDDDAYAGGGGRGDNSLIEQLDEFTFDAEHSNISGYFQGLYTIVHDACVILENVDPSISPIAKRTVSEAKVCIGYAYFELITLWGNVPLVDHVLKDASEYQMGNSTPEKLWAYAEKNLTEAIASGALPSKTSFDDNVTWRITKEAAQAILGKVYLWQGKNAEAAKVLDEVINSGKYKLFDQYGEMLDLANKHNCESVIEFDHPVDYSNLTLNFLNGMAMWRMSKLSMNADQRPKYAADGYGFFPPTKSLYDDFLSVEGADGYRLNQTMRTYAQLHKQIGLTVTEANLNEGYFMWKTRLKSDQIVMGMPWFSTRNVILMRYAEVLLMAAEANITVNPDKAVKYFNIIRERAKAPEVTSLTLPMLQKEKRLELCFEGTRFQDLTRWGIAYDKLKDCGKQMAYLQTDGTVTYRDLNNIEYGFKKGKNELLPFPAVELRVNSNIKQNPGY